MKIAIVTGASSGLGKEFVKQIEHLYKELDEIW
ncbi:MAG: short-chain dehydrogenase, partial [[Clostridium] nexile]